MVGKHYKKQLNAFVDRELAKDEHQQIAEHLLTCASCRREHDRIKLGASLASQLPRLDAREHVWTGIEDALDGRPTPQITLMPPTRHFGLRNWAGYAVALVVAV